MKSHLTSLLLFVVLFFSAIAVADKDPKDVKGGAKNMKVSKVGNGLSYLDLTVNLRYREKFSDAGSTSSRIRRRIQVNDTELVELLDFKKKDRKKVTYVDLKYAVLNDTKIFTLFDLFARDDLDIPMAKDSSFSSTKVTQFIVGDNDESGGNQTVMYKPSRLHRKARDTLTGAVLPTYLLIGIISLICYVGRAKFFPDNRALFKFSNVSKLIFRFVVIRLSYDIIYLSYLIMFVNFDFFNTNGFLYFCFLVSDEVINLIAFYFVIAIFVEGYMTLSQDKKALFALQTIGLTFLYFISVTTVDIYYKAKFHNRMYRNARQIITPITVDPNSFIAPVIVLSKITIFWASGYFAYVKYTSTPKKNPRFLISLLVIVVAYYGSSLISIPIFTSFNDVAVYARAKFLSVLPNFYFERVEAPQLIQLAVSCWLIYYWRDLSYDKVSSEQDLENSYELN